MPEVCGRSIMPAKNKTFRRRYVIEIRGITTNNFMEKLIDRALETLLDNIKNDFKQVEVTSFEAKNVGEGKNANTELQDRDQVP